MEGDIYSNPPFSSEKQLCEESGILPNAWLYHDALIRDREEAWGLSSRSATKNRPPFVQDILYRELCTPILDELSPYLYLVAKKSSQHIDALHVQLIKGRKIVITEDPQLHLIWFYDMIYLKPIPAYLLNHDFWARHLCFSQAQGDWSFCNAELKRVADHRSLQRLLFISALRFLRTYGYLIRHQSDFELAKDHRLIPPHCTWASFTQFIASCCHQEKYDIEIARRYAYGQIRLNRLNYAVRIFRPKTCHSRWYYHRMQWNTRAYIEQYFGPILFAFGSIAVLLAALQVALSVPGYVNTLFENVAWTVSQSIIVAVGVMWIIIFGGIASLLVSQILYAILSERKGQ